MGAEHFSASCHGRSPSPFLLIANAPSGQALSCCYTISITEEVIDMPLLCVSRAPDTAAPDGEACRPFVQRMQYVRAVHGQTNPCAFCKSGACQSLPIAIYVCQFVSNNSDTQLHLAR